MEAREDPDVSILKGRLAALEADYEKLKVAVILLLDQAQYEGGCPLCGEWHKKGCLAYQPCSWEKDEDE